MNGAPGPRPRPTRRKRRAYTAARNAPWKGARMTASSWCPTNLPMPGRPDSEKCVTPDRLRRPIRPRQVPSPAGRLPKWNHCRIFVSSAGVAKYKKLACALSQARQSRKIAWWKARRPLCSPNLRPAFARGISGKKTHRNPASRDCPDSDRLLVVRLAYFIG